MSGKVDPSVQKSMKAVEKRLSGLNAKAMVAGAAIAGAGIAVGKLAIEATKNAIDFEAQMSNVSTLLDGNTEAVNKRIGELSDQLINVSNVSGKSTDDLTDGLYQVISAFGDSADSAKTLEIAAKAATAGNATTTDSINLLSAVTKGYGDTTAKAQQKAADLAFATVKLGQTSFPELAANMGKVIPLASTLSVKEEDLFGAMATLTGVTGNTAEVSTQLKATMQSFLQPTDAMQKAIENYGFSSGKAMLESQGLQGALDLLKQSANGNELEFAKLFSSVEAKSAVLAMTGEQSDNLKQKTEAMYKSAGMAESAFAAQTDNLKTKMDVLKNKFENTKTTVGMKLIPVISEVADKVFPYLSTAADWIVVAFDKISNGITTYVVPAFQQISPIVSSAADFIKLLGDHMNIVIPVVGSVAAAIGIYKLAMLSATIANKGGTLAILAGVKAKIADKVQTLTLGALYAKDAILKGASTAATIAQTAAQGAWNIAAGIGSTVTMALGAAIKFLTGPIGLVILAITALIAAGVWLYNNWDLVKERAAQLGIFLSGVWTNIKTAVSNLISGIKETFLNGFNALVGIVKAPINAVIGIINGAIGGINSVGFDVPDWVPLVGGKSFHVDIPQLPLLAKGGFTNGVSIAGEEGTEAVISFDPSVRADNLSYWAKAGQMLGADNSDFSLITDGGSKQTAVEIGEINFSPKIEITGNADKADVMAAIEAEYPEFTDMLDRYFKERGYFAYGY